MAKSGTGLFSSLRKLARSFGGGGAETPAAGAPSPGTAKRGVSIAPRPVRVVDVVHETPDAVSLHLEGATPNDLRFRPGQFLTFELTLDGSVYRRAYSICTSHGSPERVAVTVKRVANGRVSNHFHDTVKAGDTLHVLGPSGSFGVDPHPETRRQAVLLAGGSGITPMMAITRAILAGEPDSRVVLLYGNRGERDIIFQRALVALANEHAPRLVVRHVLSDPPEGWSGGTGLLNREVIARELDALGVEGDAEYFLCGPEAMRVEARIALKARGVPDARLQEEKFVSPAAHAVDTKGAGQLLTLHGITGEKRLLVKPGQTVLDAGLAAGLDMPYSCAMGGCATCRVKLREGEVDMDEPNCLSAEERAEGYVLACVSRLHGPAVVEVDAVLE